MAKAYPGCEVMVARKGTVVFQKCYGYQTYDNRTPVKEEDLFDLASVTKISASLPGFMLLDTEGKFSPDQTLGQFAPLFQTFQQGRYSTERYFFPPGRSDTVYSVLERDYEKRRKVQEKNLQV